MITIIDYGAGNIRSIQNMLRKLGADSCISSDVNEIESAQKLILPGVGHFDHGMNNLKSRGLIDVLNKLVLINKVPILGICLGAQLLGNKSEEGTEQGLGWIDMDIVRFKKKQLPANFKIPHMGWNRIQSQKTSPLLEGLESDSRFYFVHSYYMLPRQQLVSLTNTNYGHSFVSAVQSENIYGVQFHPEKSHQFGMRLLKNYTEL